MTVAELIDELRSFDPSTVVVVESLGWRDVVYPVDDFIRPERVEVETESYQCAVLKLTSWPS